MQPTLSVIDIDINAGQDEIAREGLLENLASSPEQCITPLWVNWLRERADLRVVCLVHDLGRFDDFLVDVIRSVPGVRGTSARLAFDGVVCPDALMDIAMAGALWDRRAAATVEVKSQPGLDREVFETLVRLPKHREVEVVWVLKTFHSSDADLLLLLLGERTAALTGYTMSWVRTAHGVVDTQMTTVLDWQILGQSDDFLTLIERFPESAPCKQIEVQERAETNSR
jgi:DNA-binding Lrp family transcriptional regulator